MYGNYTINQSIQLYLVNSKLKAPRASLGHGTPKMYVQKGIEDSFKIELVSTNVVMVSSAIYFNRGFIRINRRSAVR